MPQVEIFTPTGVLAGSADHVPHFDDASDLLARLELDESQWFPIDGSPPRPGSVPVAPDDVLVVVAAIPETAVHMTWHTIVLDVGPYRVTGDFATQPGFDPSKSITRPSGSFVHLRDVAIELLPERIPTNGPASATRESVHVNRYAVELVDADLMLGHFFPGARLVAPETAPVA